MINLYNTYKLEKESFQPQQGQQVKMYVCGPTVYDYIHIGNARSAVAFDVIRRYLMHRGYDVKYVSNFTDVDDKIINRAQAESKSEVEVAQTYIDAFNEDTKQINVLPATVRTQATDVIPDIIEFIEDLIAKEFAYENGGNVFFRVKRSEGYALLAHQDLDELEANASGRITAEEEALKEDPLDFVLWKKEVRPGVIFWDSPWGPGRPGWHIECSVMSQKYLGDTIDIHGGGIDLTFPHHTNEIAQSQAHTGKQFVKYWLHNGFANINNEKMSKSKNNFVTLHELLQQYDAQVVRYWLATTHYRRPINFTDQSLVQAEQEFNKIKNAYQRLAQQVDQAATATEMTDASLTAILTQFETAMDDDFNVANGVSALMELVSLANQMTDISLMSQALYLFDQLLNVLGINLKVDSATLSDEAQALFDQRAIARQNKDFQASDELRDQLAAIKIVVEDTPSGQTWHQAE